MPCRVSCLSFQPLRCRTSAVMPKALSTTAESVELKGPFPLFGSLCGPSAHLFLPTRRFGMVRSSAIERKRLEPKAAEAVRELALRKAPCALATANCIERKWQCAKNYVWWLQPCSLSCNASTKGCTWAPKGVGQGPWVSLSGVRVWVGREGWVSGWVG